MKQRWFEVLVTIPGVDQWVDAVWATNEYEAKIVAEWNWEDAEVEVL